MPLSLARLSRKVEASARAAAARAKRQDAALKRHEQRLAKLEKKKLDRAAAKWIRDDNARRGRDAGQARKSARLELAAERREERKRRKEEF